MAKTAPTNFPVAPQQQLLPLEPVIESTKSALVQGLNHVARYLTPTVVWQLFQYYTAAFPAGTPYLDTAAQANDAVLTTRCAWRIPTLAGIRVPPMLYMGLWCAGAAAAQWQVNSLGSGLNNLAGPGPLAAWTEFRLGLQYSTALAYDTITLQSIRTGGVVGNHCGLKAITIWIVEGDNPQPLGIDVEPWVADHPLATYMQRTIATKIAALNQARMGVIVSYSADLDNLGRTTYQIQNTGGVAVETTVIRELPIQAGPLRAAVRYHVNGYSTGAADRVRIWTDTTGQAGGVLVNLPIAAAFLPTTGWQTGTVALTPKTTKAADRLYVSLIVQPGQTARITGLCAWEEPT
jgi:hypothetical protein